MPYKISIQFLISAFVTGTPASRLCDNRSQKDYRWSWLVAKEMFRSAVKKAAKLFCNSSKEWSDSVMVEAGDKNDDHSRNVLKNI